MFAATRLRDNSYARTAKRIKEISGSQPSTRHTQRIHLDSVIKKNYNDLHLKGMTNEEKDRGAASIIRTMQLIDRTIEPL